MNLVYCFEKSWEKSLISFDYYTFTLDYYINSSLDTVSHFKSSPYPGEVKPNTRFLFYKHQRYKHRQAEISPKCFHKIDVPMQSASIYLWIHLVLATTCILSI